MLAALPEADRELLMMREVEGISAQDIAEIIGVAYATTRWRIHQARKRFKQLWTERYGEDPGMSTTPDIPNEDDDAAFWASMRSAMAAHGRPAGARMPRPVDPAAIRRRAARESETEQRVIRTTWWARAGWISAAAAGLTVAVLALRGQPAGPIDSATNDRLAAIEAQLAEVTSQRDALADASNQVFTEDGSAVVIPSADLKPPTATCPFGW